ncbi:MAG: O-antigen ligase family protein [Proteobacteria bacterium]|jgi:hypothetical protein|nr:O-antigen ligase family protein [Pseudomonadota bacterium]
MLDSSATTQQKVLQRAVIGVVFVGLAISVLFLPPYVQVAIPIAVVAVFAFPSHPAWLVVGVITLRIIVDLAWMMPPVFGLNAMEVYSGGVAALAGLMCLIFLNKVQGHPFVLPFLLFVLAVFLSALQDMDIRFTSANVAKYISPILVMFLVSTLFEQHHRRIIINIILLLAIVPILFGFLHLATGQMQEMWLDGYFRLRGGYHNIHNAAHTMAFFFCLSLFVAATRTSKKEIAAILAFGGLCFILMFLTYVRTPMLGIAAFIPVFLLVERRWGLLALSVGAGLMAFAYNSTVAERFGDVFLFFSSAQPDQMGQLGSGRIGVWLDSLEDFVRYPMFSLLFGVGMRGPLILGQEGLDSHNDYLLLLYTFGPIGVMTHLLFQVHVFFNCLWLRRHSIDPWVYHFANFNIALGVMVIVTNIVSSSYVTRINIAVFFWSLGGMVYGCVLDEKRRLFKERSEGRVASPTGDPR